MCVDAIHMYLCTYRFVEPRTKFLRRFIHQDFSHCNSKNKKKEFVEERKFILIEINLPHFTSGAIKEGINFVAVSPRILKPCQIVFG